MPSPDAEPQWRENAAGASGRVSVWILLWRSRELISFFALRDLRVRYKQAFLGAVWVLVQPIASVVTFTLVFSRLAGIGSQGVPYPLFALVGMSVWTYFSTAAARGSEVFVNNPQLITKVSFSRIAGPAAAVLPPMVDLAISMTLVIPLFFYYGVAPTWRILTAPIWLGLLLLMAFGVGTLLSAVSVRYRDVQHAIGPVMQILLFTSPVAYPSTVLSGWHEFIYAVNPMTGIIGLARWSVLSAPWPGWPLLISLLSLAGVLGGGVIYFNRSEPTFADVI